MSAYKPVLPWTNELMDDPAKASAMVEREARADKLQHEAKALAVGGTAIYMLKQMAYEARRLRELLDAEARQ